MIASCVALDVSEGDVVYTKTAKYDVDTVASLSCKYGYKLSGSSSVTCQDSRNWNQPEPNCTQSNKININLLTFCITFSLQLVTTDE